MSALNDQIGGAHYKDMPIQPIEFIRRNQIGFIEGSVIKYLCRWEKKGGLTDLLKAKHFLEILIEMQKKEEADAIHAAKILEDARTAPAEQRAMLDPGHAGRGY